jgi:hypothetical protein
MRDFLTDEERAAIAAFPEHQVQRVPLGHMATAETFVWRKSARCNAYELQSVKPSGWRAHQKAGLARVASFRKAK